MGTLHATVKPDCRTQFSTLGTSGKTTSTVELITNECERAGKQHQPKVKLTKSVGRAVIGQNIIITNPIDEITSSAQQSTSLILKRPTN